MPELVIFDLDKTLARSKQPITKDMAALLEKLLARTKIAIISGGAFPQFISQVVEQLPSRSQLENLFILPTSGGALYAFQNDTWLSAYEEGLSEDEVIRVEEVIREVCKETGLIDLSVAAFGKRVEDRGAEVTLSALGQQAPLEAKEAWDPSGAKKQTLREAIAKRLPEYDVKTGGSTSIDVTKHGINKAYGIKRLDAYLAIPIQRMLYVGDALYPGGNDEVVKETGIRTHEVKDPEDTEKFIQALLNERDE